MFQIKNVTSNLDKQKEWMLMNLLNQGSKVGIVACSNGFSHDYGPKLSALCHKLEELGLVPVLSSCIYAKESVASGTGKERAMELMNFFWEPDIAAIFDISGGNIANEVIEYLDYESIARNPKPMFGYSDLTCVLNAIYAKTNVITYLYQIRNIMYGFGREQKEWLQKSLLQGKQELYQFPVSWLQGTKVKGIAVGGNIRCLLKLAGTEYFPKMKDKVLVLESYGGDPGLMRSFLTQLKHMGVFEQIAGILLGTFTEMEEKQYRPAMDEIVKEIVSNPKLPIAKTKWFGHGIDSKCIRIGEKIELSK